MKSCTFIFLCEILFWNAHISFRGLSVTLEELYKLLPRELTICIFVKHADEFLRFFSAQLLATVAHHVQKFIRGYVAVTVTVEFPVKLQKSMSSRFTSLPLRGV